MQDDISCVLFDIFLDFEKWNGKYYGHFGHFAGKKKKKIKKELTLLHF